MKDGLPDTVERFTPPVGWVSLSPETYDRFRDGYIALLDALAEARPYVYNIARQHRDSPRGQTAEDVLERIDAAREMRSNLAEKTSA